MTNSSMKTLPAVDISVLSGYVKTHIQTGIWAAMQNQNYVHFLIASALSGTGPPTCKGASSGAPLLTLV